MNLPFDNLFLSSIFSYLEFSYQPALKASLFFLSTNLSKQPRTLFNFLYFFSIFFTKGSNDTFIQSSEFARTVASGPFRLHTCQCVCHYNSFMTEYIYIYIYIYKIEKNYIMFSQDVSNCFEFFFNCKAT